MKKQSGKDPMTKEIEHALKPGRFIDYHASWDFVDSLENVKTKIDALIKNGEAQRAVSLYEIFLAGCYEKAEELDDSSDNLGSFLGELFCDWIKARQKAGCQAEETVSHILRWIENDDYGFCSHIEDDISLALNKEGLAIFTGHFNNLLTKAYIPFASEKPKHVHEYPGEVSSAVNTLKKIYSSRKDIKSYMALCEEIAISPDDCQTVAKLQIDKGHFDKALEMVEKGIALKSLPGWGSQDGSYLSRMKQEILGKLGRKDEAFTAAWEAYEDFPSLSTYDDIMKYSPEDERLEWHRKAMDIARAGVFYTFVEICVESKDWAALAERILLVEDKEIEAISHYITEKAAEGLKKDHALAAAKTFRALGMRIIDQKKSKYYSHALRHFQKARDLYIRSGREDLWHSIINEIRRKHSRKYGFIGGFERIAAGAAPESPPSFESKMRKRWEKQTK